LFVIAVLALRMIGHLKEALKKTERRTEKVELLENSQ